MNQSVITREVALTVSGLKHPLQGRWFLPGSPHAHPDRPSAVVVVVHGLGEHQGRYQELACRLVENLGAAVLTYDQRGHGLSPGPRGVVKRWEENLDDLELAVHKARQQAHGAPLFVLGHSQGGLIALTWTLDHVNGSSDLRGLVVSNPALAIKVPVLRWQRWAADWLKAWPRITLGTPLTPDQLTRDPERQAAYRADRLVHNRINATLFLGMIERGPTLVARAREWSVPLLMILGGADPVIEPATSLAFFEAVGTADKTLIHEPNALHEPLNDLNRNALFDQVTTWIRARVPIRQATDAISG